MSTPFARLPRPVRDDIARYADLRSRPADPVNHCLRRAENLVREQVAITQRTGGQETPFAGWVTSRGDAVRRALQAMPGAARRYLRWALGTALHDPGHVAFLGADVLALTSPPAAVAWTAAWRDALRILCALVDQAPTMGAAGEALYRDGLYRDGLTDVLGSLFEATRQVPRTELDSWGAADATRFVLAHGVLEYAHSALRGCRLEVGRFLTSYRSAAIVQSPPLAQATAHRLGMAWAIIVGAAPAETPYTPDDVLALATSAHPAVRALAPAVATRAAAAR